MAALIPAYPACNPCRCKAPFSEELANGYIAEKVIGKTSLENSFWQSLQKRQKSTKTP